MRTVTLTFSARHSAAAVGNILRAAFGPEAPAGDLAALETLLRREAAYVEIRRAGFLTGEAKERLAAVLDLFTRVRDELGEEHFDFKLLPDRAVTIDLYPCRSSQDLYRTIREGLGLEEGLANNLDGLWDALTGMPLAADEITLVRPRFFHGVEDERDLDFTGRVDRVCGLFEEAREECGNFRVSAAGK